MTDWTISEAALTIPCAYCGAEVDYPCKTISGRAVHYSHQARSNPLRCAFGEGYEEGFDTGKEWERRHSERAAR